MENEESGEWLRLSEDNILENNLKEYNYDNDNGYVFGVYDGDIEQVYKSLRGCEFVLLC